MGECEAYVPHQQLTDDKNLIQPKSGELPKKKKKSKKSYDCTEAPFIKGRCRAALNKWSWNPETLKCESFVLWVRWQLQQLSNREEMHEKVRVPGQSTPDA